MRCWRTQRPNPLIVSPTFYSINGTVHKKLKKEYLYEIYLETIMLRYGSVRAHEKREPQKCS